ncbi:hypothetical protein MtrunA17_Chr4g0018811 [Medicago truncatula]|uniref:Uncharacterized protein n=1 Tax=Medicago truncatula TaxID=3880 RepID=A0A072UUA2_MEDTR|nr:hypothetical protein MTR_4g036715 [Medicago truncatula]RHN59861.1 hypothetical protein MtrunA17_Chr4g0018811 [Medicago truncatula]
MEKEMRSEEEEVEDLGKNNHSKTQVPLFLFISPSPSYSFLSPSIPSHNLRRTPPSLSLCHLLPPFSPTPNPPSNPWTLLSDEDSDLSTTSDPIDELNFDQQQQQTQPPPTNPCLGH